MASAVRWAWTRFASPGAVFWLASMTSLASLPSCWPLDDALAACRDAGRCPGSEDGGLADGGSVDGGSAGGGAADAAVNHELAQWRAPPEQPAQYVAVGPTTLDSWTGLVWQREAGNGGQWSGAVKECEGLNTAGFGGVFKGWRLPTAVELLSLVDSSARAPAVNLTAFPATSGAYWTASEAAADGGMVWLVGFDRGNTLLVARDGTAGTRCVRAGDSVGGGVRFERRAGAGVVRDGVTGLSWQAEPAPSRMSLADARTYCAGRTGDAGGPTWRLPTKKELESLVVRQGGGWWLDDARFSVSQVGFHWSSTAVVVTEEPASTWGVDFSDGRSTWVPDTLLRSVRCVFSEL